MGRIIMATARSVWSAVSPTGRWTLAVGLVAWVVGRQLGWDEFMLVAAGCVFSVLAALLFTVGRAHLQVDLEVEPRRLVVGEQAVGRVLITNVGKRRTLHVAFEAPVGSRGHARFEMPSLAAAATWDDVFVIETTRRCVMDIGPVSSVRGDPLGLARRAVALTEPVELFVHPRTVRLAGLTAGWIRDLEGQPTKELSPSDVAFHTLREYVPGDDRRHIHWRSSAKLGTLLVRQFVDSRRSHLGLVLSTNPSDYADDDEFELTVSVVGSLGASALTEDQAVSVTTGGRPLPSHGRNPLLDALSGVDLVERSTDMSSLAQRSIPVVRGASVVAIVTGSRVGPAELRTAAQRFHHDVRVLAVSVRPGADANLKTIGSTSVLELGALDQLARVLRATVAR